MKTLILSTILVSCLGSSAFGGIESFGGGGIVRNGQYLTIGSSGVPLEEVYKSFPEVDLVVNKLAELGFDDGMLGRFIRALTSNPARAYYKVKSIDENLHRELLKIYHKEFSSRLPDDRLAIFAVTRNQETYLLPSFEQLDAISKAAILLHEALWVIDPKLSYNEVIRVEAAFERYLRCEKMCAEEKMNFFMSFTDVIDHPYMLLKMAFQNDIAHGSLQGFLTSDNRMSLRSFLGSSIMDKNFLSGRTADRGIMGTEFSAHLYRLIQRYPQSYTLKILQELLPRLVLHERERDSKYLKMSERDAMNLPQNAQSCYLEKVSIDFSEALDKSFIAFTGREDYWAVESGGSVVHPVLLSNPTRCAVRDGQYETRPIGSNVYQHYKKESLYNLAFVFLSKGYVKAR